MMFQMQYQKLLNYCRVAFIVLPPYYIPPSQAESKASKKLEKGSVVNPKDMFVPSGNVPQAQSKQPSQCLAESKLTSQPEAESKQPLKPEKPAQAESKQPSQPLAESNYLLSLRWNPSNLNLRSQLGQNQSDLLSLRQNQTNLWNHI